MFWPDVSRSVCKCMFYLLSGRELDKYDDDAILGRVLIGKNTINKRIDFGREIRLLITNDH